MTTVEVPPYGPQNMYRLVPLYVPTDKALPGWAREALFQLLVQPPEWVFNSRWISDTLYSHLSPGSQTNRTQELIKLLVETDYFVRIPRPRSVLASPNMKFYKLDLDGPIKSGRLQPVSSGGKTKTTSPRRQDVRRAFESEPTPTPPKAEEPRLSPNEQLAEYMRAKGEKTYSEMAV